LLTKTAAFLKDRILEARCFEKSLMLYHAYFTHSIFDNCTDQLLRQLVGITKVWMPPNDAPFVFRAT